MRRKIIQRPSRATFYQDTGFGEFFVGQSGVTFSDPRIHEGVVGEDDISCLEVDDPWFADSVDRVMGKLAASSSVLVEGDLGAGKSTTVFGLRTRLRQEQIPYTHIDGHYTNRATRQAPAIKSALKHGREVLMIDSFDYLFLRRKYDRSSGKARGVLLPVLEEFISDGGKAVLTSHTQPWLDLKSSPELVETMQQVLPDNLERVRVGTAMDEPDIRAVTTKIFGPEFADQYLDLSNNSLPTARTYRVAKQIGKRLEKLDGLSQRQFDEAVGAIDEETRVKMGVDASYQLH